MSSSAPKTGCSIGSAPLMRSLKCRRAAAASTAAAELQTLAVKNTTRLRKCRKVGDEFTATEALVTYNFATLAICEISTRKCRSQSSGSGCDRSSLYRAFPPVSPTGRHRRQRMCEVTHCVYVGAGLVMSIGNQEFGIPRKYQYQIGIWYLCLKFLDVFLVIYRNLE